VRPDTIDLHLELDPAATAFRGEASYSLELDRARRTLVLHAAGLRVSRIRLHVAGETWKGRAELRPEDETLHIAFDHTISAGRCRLELAFRGRVRSDLRGLYRAQTDGLPWIASQLCPTDARRVLPCFDEPGVKARYRIRITAPRDQSVISNAPVSSEEPVDGERKIVHFEPTPPLSVYLVAVAVGPFEASPPLQCGTTEIRVHTLPGRLALASFAREAAAESLTRLECYFDLPHPYPKLDLVALPAFAFGAMENAGAVFFRDSILLLDAARASAGERKRSAEVIAHELSHMWFGNLVTMAWWNDLWLNESFATWMAYEIVDDWRPDWRIWLDFAHRREQALEADALASSHPIAPKIRSAEEAQENFDAITYTKGACVLRMLERYLGPETFREGIRLYMRRHREGVAEAADLWSALAEVSDAPVEAIVAPWTLQTGYPLVSLRRRERAGVATLELAQQRFLARPPGRRPQARPRAKGAPRREPRWKIPWIGRTGGRAGGGSRSLRHLLTKRREPLDDRETRASWLYGNADESGFFRVEHTEEMQRDLRANLARLAPIERIGLVGHQWALVRAGRAPIASVLDLLAALGSEGEPDVLVAVEHVLTRLFQRLAPSRGATTEARLRRWIELHFGGQVDGLGLAAKAGEEESVARRRATLFAIVGGLAGAARVVDRCRHDARTHLIAERPLPSELADVVLCVAARQGDEALHDALCEATRRADTPQTRQRSLFALAEFVEPGLIRRSLAAADDEGLAPRPDRASLLMIMLARRASAEPTWRHVQRCWRRLEKGLPPILLARLAATTSAALPPSAAKEIRTFFTRHPLAAGSRVLRQVAEELAIARRFEQTAGPALEVYLSDASDREAGLG
jgi:puromycin-sensitive aminopeptidase